MEIRVVCWAVEVEGQETEKPPLHPRTHLFSGVGTGVNESHTDCDKTWFCFCCVTITNIYQETIMGIKFFAPVCERLYCKSSKMRAVEHLYVTSCL